MRPENRSREDPVIVPGMRQNRKRSRTATSATGVPFGSDPSCRMQPQMRIEPEHVVHVLDGGATGAFDQIIDRADQDDPRSIFANRDIDEVGTGYIPRRWQMRDDSYKSVERVVAVEALADLVRRGTGIRMSVDRRQDPSLHRHQVGSEDDFGFDA